MTLRARLFKAELDSAAPSGAKIDIRCPGHSLSAVSAPRYRLLSVFFVALWLMATQHCALEAAGLFADHGTAEASGGCCGAKAKGCETDGCKTIEDGQYRSEARLVKAVAPDLTSSGCLLCVHLLLAEPKVDAAFAVKDRWNEAPDWVPSWQFERRAAAPAHAPDSLIA